VRDLPNYLPLPQPITLLTNSPTYSSEESSHNPRHSPARAGVKLADQTRCEKASGSRSAQSICQADKNTAPEFPGPDRGPGQPSRSRPGGPWSTNPALEPLSMRLEHHRKTPSP
jgi:hypothetical protein